jgi:hypothetical protein
MTLEPDFLSSNTGIDLLALIKLLKPSAPPFSYLQMGMIIAVFISECCKDQIKESLKICLAYNRSPINVSYYPFSFGHHKAL